MKRMKSCCSGVEERGADIIMRWLEAVFSTEAGRQSRNGFTITHSGFTRHWLILMEAAQTMRTVN